MLDGMVSVEWDGGGWWVLDGMVVDGGCWMGCWWMVAAKRNIR